MPENLSVFNYIFVVLFPVGFRLNCCCAIPFTKTSATFNFCVLKGVALCSINVIVDQEYVGCVCHHIEASDVVKWWGNTAPSVLFSAQNDLFCNFIGISTSKLSQLN